MQQLEIRIYAEVPDGEHLLWSCRDLVHEAAREVDEHGGRLTLATATLDGAPLYVVHGPRVEVQELAEVNGNVEGAWLLGVPDSGARGGE